MYRIRRVVFFLAVALYGGMMAVTETSAQQPATSVSNPSIPPNVELIDLIDQNPLHTGGKDGPRLREDKSLEELVNTSQKEVIVILADELRLGVVSFALGNGSRLLREIVILAKTIHVEDRVVFNLEHPSPFKLLLFGQNRPIRDAINGTFFDYTDPKNPKSLPQYAGRNLTVLANQIRFQGLGRIELKQRDYLRVIRDQLGELRETPGLGSEFRTVLTELKADDIRKGEPGYGGRFRLAARRFWFPRNWADHWEKDRTTVYQQYADVTQGGHTLDGTTQTEKFPDALADWVPPNITAYWLARRLELVDGRFAQADIKSDWRGIKSVFDDINELPELSLLGEEQRKRATAIFGRIKAAREKYDRIRSESVAIPLEGGTRTTLVFAEGVTGRVTMLPTDLLMTRRSLNGKDYLGTVRLLADGEQVEFTFSTRMTTDPILREQLRRKLVERHYRLEGLFTSLKLSVDNDRRPAHVNELKILNTDEYLTFTLVVSRKSANLVLSQLAMAPGLPIALKYETTTHPKESGEVTFNLSLSRRAEIPLLIQKDRIHNTGPRTFYVSLIQTATDGFVRLTPALTVEPLSYAKISLLPGLEVESFTVPAEGIHFRTPDVFSLEDFYPVDKEDLVERISVTNRLTDNPERGGRLKRVKIDVTYLVGEGSQRTENPAGSFELGAFNSANYVKEIHLLKPRSGKVQIQVKGTAQYENGNAYFDSIQDGREFLIAESLLPKIRR